MAGIDVSDELLKSNAACENDHFFALLNHGKPIHLLLVFRSILPKRRGLLREGIDVLLHREAPGNLAGGLDTSGASAFLPRWRRQPIGFGHLCRPPSGLRL